MYVDMYKDKCLSWRMTKMDQGPREWCAKQAHRETDRDRGRDREMEMEMDGWDQYVGMACKNCVDVYYLCKLVVESTEEEASQVKQLYPPTCW